MAPHRHPPVRRPAEVAPVVASVVVSAPRPIDCSSHRRLPALPSRICQHRAQFVFQDLAIGVARQRFGAEGNAHRHLKSG